MNKILLITIISFSIALSGCSGEQSTETDTGFITKNFQNFSIQIPNNWNQIFKKDFANTIPKETVALFIHKKDGEDFIQNTNIIKESLNTDASSLEYAKANILLATKALIDYRSINTEEYSSTSGKTVIHNFQARNTTTEPLRYYYQIYYVINKIGYTTTCNVKNNETIQQENCQNILKSFKLK